jgi:hypothetical protein
MARVQLEKDENTIIFKGDRYKAEAFEIAGLVRCFAAHCAFAEHGNVYYCTLTRPEHRSSHFASCRKEVRHDGRDVVFKKVM